MGPDSRNRTALAAYRCSVVGLVPFLGLLFGPLGVVLGVIAWRQDRARPDGPQGGPANEPPGAPFAPGAPGYAMPPGPAPWDGPVPAWTPGQGPAGYPAPGAEVYPPGSFGPPPEGFGPPPEGFGPGPEGFVPGPDGMPPGYPGYPGEQDEYVPVPDSPLPAQDIDWQVTAGAGVTSPRSVTQVLSTLAGKVAQGDVDQYQPVPLGFTPLDKTIGGGLRAGELLLIGGAQGTGKTTMSVQMARNIVMGGQASVLYVCYEHDEEYLLNRIIAMESALQHLPGREVLEIERHGAEAQYERGMPSTCSPT